MNELREAIANIIQMASQIIDELDDETMLALVDLLNAARERLAQEAENPVEGLPPTTPEGVPNLDQGPYPSSNVNSFKYDPRSGRLFVKFHGAESADAGPVYKYEGIPKNIYDLFSQGRVGPKTSGSNQYHTWIKGVTPSLGASLYALIRNGGYPYQRMS